MNTRRKKIEKLEADLLGGPLSFADAVNAARLNAELSQVDLGKAVSMSRSRICDIEKGRRGVSLEGATAIAEALGVSPAVFVKLALQDQVNRAGIGLVVEVHAA